MDLRNKSGLRGTCRLWKKCVLKLAVFKWLYAINFKEVIFILKCKKSGLGRGGEKENLIKLSCFLRSHTHVVPTLNGEIKTCNFK